MDLTLGIGKSLGYRKLTVSTTAVGLSDATDPSTASAPAIPAGARYCALVVKSFALNVRDDGVNPTSTVGFPLAANDSIAVQRVSNDLKFIRTEGTDAIVHLWYFD